MKNKTQRTGALITALFLTQSVVFFSYEAQAAQKGKTKEAPTILETSESTESTDSTNNLISLHYFVPHRGWLIQSDLSVMGNDSEEKDSSGNTISKSTTSSLDSDLAVTYGVMDRLDLGLAESYQFNHKNDSKSTGSTTTDTQKSKGFSDPTLELLYRFLSEPSSPLLGDFQLAVTPSLIKAKSSSTTRDGNNASGATSVAVGPHLYYSTGPNEFGATLLGEYNFSGTTDGGTPDEITTKPYLVGAFTLQYRGHLSEVFYFQLSGVLNFGFSTESNIKSNNSTSKTSIPLVAYPIGEIGYLFMHGGLVYLRLEYINYKADYSTTPPGGSSINNSEQFKQSTLSAGVKFTF